MEEEKKRLEADRAKLEAEKREKERKEMAYKEKVEEIKDLSMDDLLAGLALDKKSDPKKPGDES